MGGETEGERSACSRCLLFRYTGSYSRFISGCMDGGFRLLRLSHSLTQSFQPLFFPASLANISVRVPLVYFNTPPREEIDGTRYELAALWKSRRLGADFDNKKKEEREKGGGKRGSEGKRKTEREKGRKKREGKSRINDFCRTRDPDREIACKLDGVNFATGKEILASVARSKRSRVRPKPRTSRQCFRLIY